MSFLQRALALAALGCLMAGCQGYPFTYVPPSNNTALVTQTYISAGPATDILFVVDDSPSMADKQAALKSNAAAFINAVANSNNDYHIGIVTTDLFASTDNGRLRMATAGHPVYMSRTAALADPNGVNSVIADFTGTVGSLGIAGSDAEAALGGALAALDPNGHPAAGAANQGFYRQDADLALIIVTDEDDCTFQTQYASEQTFWEVPANCYQNTDKMQDVNTLLQFFVNLKGGNVAKVRAALIGGGSSGQTGSLFAPRGCLVNSGGTVEASCGCWFYSNDSYFCSSLNSYDQQPCTTCGSCSNTMCPSNSSGTCDTARCTATPSKRYYDFINLLTHQRQAAGLSSGTYMDSICQSDYQQSLLAIAATVVQPTCFPVPQQGAANPNDITLEVTRVGGNGGRTLGTSLPRFDPNDTTAACQTCGGACASGAWQLMNGNAEACLVCGAVENTGDDYIVTVYDPKASTP